MNNTQYLFVKTGRKTGKFLGLIIGVLAVLLLSWGTGFASTYTPLDDFSDSPAVNKVKWGQYESIREINEGRLRLKARSSRHYTSSVSMSLPIRSPETVNTIAADMALHAYDNAKAASMRLRFQKTFYNDTTGTDRMGDVGAAVTIGGTAAAPIAYFSVWRTSSEDGSQSQTLDYHVFSTTPVLDTTYSASLSWNSGENTITGTFNGQSFTYTAVTTVEDPHYPYCGLRAEVSSNFANGEGKEATVEGFFDNVTVNGSAYDDFSVSPIDEAKWSSYEYVREIVGGKLRLKARSSTGYTSPAETYLSMSRSGNAKAIQAKVRLVSFNNPTSGVRSGAQVYGRFFNDGSMGGGYTGDYQALVALGSTGTSPGGHWAVLRYSGAGSDTGVLVASGDFTTPITIGVDYIVSVDWDGSKFIFKIDSETIEYAPTGLTIVLPPNRGTKGVDTLISNNFSGEEASVEAQFDDVMFSQSSEFYGGFTGYGLYKYDNDTWARIHETVPTKLTVASPFVYAFFNGYGLYKYDGSTWTLIHTMSPVSMMAFGTVMYATFDGYGLYKYDSISGTWTQIHGTIPASMTLSPGSTLFLYATFSGYGLYRYDGNTWTRIHETVPLRYTASGSIVYAGFTGYGLYKYDGSTWTLIHGTIPASIYASDTILYANFTGYGLYKYDYDTWTQLHSVVPTNTYVTGFDVYATYSGYGLYNFRYEVGPLAQIHGTVPASRTNNGSVFYANFTSYGLYKCDNGAWTQIHSTIPTIFTSSTH